MHRIALPAILLFTICLTGPASGQDREFEDHEPEVADIDRPMSHLDFDMRNGAGLRIQVNNFGFGIGGEYRRVISRYTKGFFEFQINNVRDESEQTFQDFFGFNVIPNKYNRILAFPAMLGVSRRLFAQPLSDNFRLFVQASGGPTAAFVYPYYDHDFYNMGFRPQFRGLNQQHYDPFQGWSEGEFILGASGQLAIGANLGGDFGNIQSIRIGYFFHYFPQGIQVMEPFRPGDNIGNFDFDLPPEEQGPGVVERAADEQSFFGTPQITIVFGTMW